MIYKFFFKRPFDILLSALLISFFWWAILISWIVATIENKSNGFFFQDRVGRNGKIFKIVKIKSMRQIEGFNSTVTDSTDPRITKSGSFLRRYKLDELPQLWNVLIGDMSLVGPRPDVSGYADKLEPKIKNVLLSVRPGITGPASIFYRDEEQLLAGQSDPRKFNDEVIYPHKVRINIEYIYNQSFFKDCYFLLRTLL